MHFSQLVFTIVHDLASRFSENENNCTNGHDLHYWKVSCLPKKYSKYPESFFSSFSKGNRLRSQGKGCCQPLCLCHVSHWSSLYKIGQYCSPALWPNSMGCPDQGPFAESWQQMDKVCACLRSVNTSVPGGIGAESRISPQTPRSRLSGVKPVILDL